MSSSWYAIAPTVATVKFYGFDKVAAKSAESIGARLHSTQTACSRTARAELVLFQTRNPERASTAIYSCPRAKMPETRATKKLDRDGFAFLLKRLQMPTLSYEVATGQFGDTQVPEPPATAAPAARTHSGIALKRVMRPTTASMHKRVGICPFCIDLDATKDAWESGCENSTGFSEKELPIIVERLRSPTFSSKHGSGSCRRCVSVSAVSEGPRASSSREPLVSGLPRSPTLAHIVDRLFRGRKPSGAGAATSGHQ